MSGLLQGQVALVTGGTRGAGRGIAVALGAAGATVYITGRTTRQTPSPLNRPETIEDTAELVTRVGGKGIAVRCDHLVPAHVAALVRRIEDEQQGRLDVLVDDMFNNRYRGSMFYDMIKVAITRLGKVLSDELRPRGVTSLSLTPGYLRSEAMLEHFGVEEANWRDAIAKDGWFAIAESPRYVGRAVAALAADPEVSRWSGQALSAGVLAKHYGFIDLDGSQPEASRFFAEAYFGEKKDANAADYR